MKNIYKFKSLDNASFNIYEKSYKNYSTNISGAKHSDNGDVLFCGGRIGDGEVMSDCVAYTPMTKVSIIDLELRTLIRNFTWNAYFYHKYLNNKPIF